MQECAEQRWKAPKSAGKGTRQPAGGRFSCCSMLFNAANKRLELPGTVPWLAGGVFVVFCWWSGAA
eukprot:14796682-Alexandrium_andersonii.AAC.1